MGQWDIGSYVLSGTLLVQLLVVDAGMLPVDGDRFKKNLDLKINLRTNTCIRQLGTQALNLGSPAALHTTNNTQSRTVFEADPHKSLVIRLTTSDFRFEIMLVIHYSTGIPSCNEICRPARHWAH